MPKEEPNSANSVNSTDSKKESAINSFKRILIEGIKVCAKDCKDHNKTENFTNGFLEGAIMSSQFILEAALHSKDNINEILLTTEAIHRSAHVLQGDFITEDGSCPFIKRYNRRSVINFTMALLKEVLEEFPKQAKEPKKEQINPKKVM